MLRSFQMATCIQTKFALLAVTVSTLILMQGCGRTDRSSSLHADREQRVPIIFMHAGWNSCRYESFGGDLQPLPTFMYSQYKKLSDKLTIAYNRFPKFVVGCYTPFKSTVDGMGRYVSSFNRTEYKRASPTEMVRLVAKLAGREPADVYLVGHSYGGWLAMKVIEGLPHKQFRIKMLATLDPISQENCNSYYFSTTYLDGGHWGCKSAPRDFSNARRQYIADRTQVWMNVYQQSYSYLHSSKIYQAHVNYKLTYSKDSYMAHGAVQTYSKVWSAVFKHLDQVVADEVEGAKSDPAQMVATN